MDGNDHRRRRLQHQGHRQALPDNSQFGDAASSDAGGFALPSQSSIRSSQFLSQTASNNASIHSTVSAQDYGPAEYAQVSPYAPPQVHGPSSTFQSSYSQLPAQSQHFPQYPPPSGFSTHQHNQPGQHPDVAGGHSSAYQQRQAVAIEVLSDQFGSHTYYDTNQGQSQAGFTSRSTSATQQSIQYTSPGQFPQQAPASSYALGNTHFAARSGYDPSWQQQQQQQQQQTEAKSNADPYAYYNVELRQTNSLTLEDRLIEARSSLSKLMNWIVDNIEVLGK